MTRKKCTQCPMTFQSQRDLDKHMKRIHGLTPADIQEKSDVEKSEFAKQCAKLLDEL